jgi:high-affinity nickel-transport protein
LFALSFDTLSQAAFFALTASQFGGWQHALLLAALFMLGMLLTDGINGLWIARLIARADQVALIASRVMGLVVSGVSLLVAAFGAPRCCRQPSMRGARARSWCSDLRWWRSSPPASSQPCV